jgi:hypothetical protein
MHYVQAQKNYQSAVDLGDAGYKSRFNVHYQVWWVDLLISNGSHFRDNSGYSAFKDNRTITDKLFVFS